MTLTLASNDKSFTLEQQRLYVAKVESHYFVVTGWVESEQGPWHKNVFAVTAKGFRKVCAFSGKGRTQRCLTTRWSAAEMNKVPSPISRVRRAQLNC